MSVLLNPLPEPRLDTVSRTVGGGAAAIDLWKAAVTAGSAAQACEFLRAAYRSHQPFLGELIFTGECTFKCSHCIYAPSFPRFNKEMSGDQWRVVFDTLRRSAGIETFVYGGRSLSEEGIDVLLRLREDHPEVQIGLIDNGISMVPIREKILDIGADWIDISIDGIEESHDKQRGKAGSFSAGLEGATWLVENGAAPRVNILTCATTINADTIAPMVRMLHARGFRNFFITPVTIVDGIRPDPSLRISPVRFAELVSRLLELSRDLDGVWLEMGMFSVEYADSVAAHAPELWRRLSEDGTSLTWQEQSGAGNSVFALRYYPISLTGTRELIINTNGNVIVPQSMAFGRIEDDFVAGNLLEKPVGEILSNVYDSPGFDFYLRELERERLLLGRYL